MTANDILDRFSRAIPVAVMARGLVEHLFSPQTLNAIPNGVQLFTYTRSIDFAQLVSLMGDVVFRVHPSVRAAYRKSPEAQSAATLKSFYEKFNRMEPNVCRAFVRQLSQRCADVAAAWEPMAPALVPGLRMRILDGNKLAATERRLDGLEKVLAPLPGQALVLQDFATGLFVDVLPWEDAYTNERALFGHLKDWWQADDLIVADCNFCTESLLRPIQIAGAFFAIRHHSGVGLHPLDAEIFVGRNASGEIFEQRVRYAQSDLELRCTIVRLDEPTRDGDREIRILTNLSRTQADAIRVAEIYRKRGGIENGFQELEAALRSEIATLAYPKAALFGFCMGLVLCNLFQVIRAATAKVPEAPKPEKISGVLLGQEIATYLGALLLLDLPTNYPQADWTAKQMAEWLLRIASRIDWRSYRKSPRGPKKKKEVGSYPRASPHEATARVLAERSKKRKNAP